MCVQHARHDPQRQAMQVLTQEAEKSHGGHAHSELCFLLIALNLVFVSVTKHVEATTLMPIFWYEHEAIAPSTKSLGMGLKGEGVTSRLSHHVKGMPPFDIVVQRASLDYHDKSHHHHVALNLRSVQA